MKNSPLIIGAAVIIAIAALGFYQFVYSENEEKPAVAPGKNVLETAEKKIETKPDTSPAGKRDIPGSTAFSSSKIDWVPYEEGIEIGKERNKKIFINFYADWCRYCVKMEKNTFTNKSVISYLNENFISIRINSDKQQRLARKYQVRGLPVQWFINSEGKPIGSQPGYLEPKLLLNILKFVNTNSYKSMTYSEFLKTS